ncbi:MAG: polyprenyl synthetase family protein [Pyrinomonadaceae bacterium]
MTLLDEFLAGVSRDVDAKLDRLMPTAEIRPRRLHEAIRWSVFAGGKRIRPAILIAVGETFGAERSTLLNAAAALEMIHTYSLIHDDLPAMDDDDLRRGKATCHVQFGEAAAILAGDVLQTLAFKAIADDASISGDTRLKLISLIADSSGTPNGMVSGQQLDLDAEKQELSIDQIAEIHRQKTGALITAAAVSGALIGLATETEIEAIRKYSENLGLLFQITDDLLDVTQETSMLGKTAGKDAVSEKATYPAHLGIQKTREMAASIRESAIGSLLSLDRDTDLLKQIVDFVFGRTK